MNEKEKELRQKRSSLMRECAEIEDRITEGIATHGDKERLKIVKEELIEVNTKLSKVSEEKQAFTKRTGLFGALSRKAKESEESKTHPIKYAAKVIVYSALVLVLIFGTIIGVVIHDAGPQAIKQAVTSYANQAAALEQIKDAMIARVSGVKNPNFDGLEVIEDKDGFVSIFPTNMDEMHKKLAVAMTKQVKDWGYDCVLIGDGYTSMSGPFLYRDFKGGTETDMEIMVNAMREKGVENCFAFMGNPDDRAMPYPIKNYVQGSLKIEKADVRRAAILWKTGESKIVFHSDNLNGQLKGDKLKAKMRDIPLEQIQQYHEKQKEKEKENPGRISKVYNYIKGKAKTGWNWALEKVE
jgi:hypothetical protein